MGLSFGKTGMLHKLSTTIAANRKKAGTILILINEAKVNIVFGWSL